nr:MAG TPA: hypothetical protein [Caudoviricetes sp.]
MLASEEMFAIFALPGKSLFYRLSKERPIIPFSVINGSVFGFILRTNINLGPSSVS